MYFTRCNNLLSRSHLFLVYSSLSLAAVVDAHVPTSASPPADSTRSPTPLPTQPSSEGTTAPPMATPTTTIPPTAASGVYLLCQGSTNNIGDALCDPENNNADCEFDGGDCCRYTCKDGGYFSCGDSGYHCQDPNERFGKYLDLPINSWGGGQPNVLVVERGRIKPHRHIIICGRSWTCGSASVFYDSGDMLLPRRTGLII